MDAAASPGLSVSSLARIAGVPVPRIKFYLREGLLLPGDLSATKRAYYDAGHVERLHLIHTLRQSAGLSLPAIRALCELLDGRGQADLRVVILRVLDAVSRPPADWSALHARERTRARRELQAWLRARGMRVRPSAPAVADLSNALAGLRQVLGPTLPVDALAPYFEAMCALAEQDFAATSSLIRDRASAGRAAALGTVLWEPVLLLLRRIAHEHVATTRLTQRSRPRAGQ